MNASETLAAIEAGVIANTERRHSNRIGASFIGHPCSRRIWYIFRWTKADVITEARKLRLFDRGDREEAYFEKLLKQAGYQVWSHDANGNQFECLDVYGHLAGKLDGVIKGIREIPEGIPALLEYKTHGDKSYKKLDNEGLVNSKYEHFVQMQIYMYKYKLLYGLYMAVNKNDDFLFLDIVKADDSVAIQHIKRAKDIAFTKIPPRRISESSAYWQCRFCHLKNICHNITDEKAEVNCRTCKHSQPVDEGQWECQKYNTILSKDLMKTGCQSHEYLDCFKK